MSNVITPGTTAIAASGKTLKLETTLTHSTVAANDRGTIIPVVASSIAFDQIIAFTIDVPAGAIEQNVWEAPSEALRAKGVLAICHEGNAALIINQSAGGHPLPFPLGAGGFASYINPESLSASVDVDGVPTETGPGIDNIRVSTEVDTRLSLWVVL